MDNNINSRKNKYLNFKERTIIEIRLNDRFSLYKIAKELGRPINTILNEIRRGSTIQIKHNKHVKLYFADTSKAMYKKNSKNSCRLFKRLECNEFISYAVDKIENDHLSPDACVY